MICYFAVACASGGWFACSPPVSQISKFHLLTPPLRQHLYSVDAIKSDRPAISRIRRVIAVGLQTHVIVLHNALTAPLQRQREFGACANPKVATQVSLLEVSPSTRHHSHSLLRSGMPWYDLRVKLAGHYVRLNSHVARCNGLRLSCGFFAHFIVITIADVDTLWIARPLVPGGLRVKALNLSRLRCL